MQDTTSTVIIVIGASRSKFWEAPETIVGTWDNSVGAGDSVEQCGTIGAVGILVVAVDLRAGGLNSGNIVVAVLAVSTVMWKMYVRMWKQP